MKNKTEKFDAIMSVVVSIGALVYAIFLFVFDK